MEIEFEHLPVSVFGDYEEFARINPVVKAPTLVTDTEEVLLDSTLILMYVRSLTPLGKALARCSVPHMAKELRLTGLSLAACEKVVQIVYETTLRPAERQYSEWLERVRRQCHAAFAALEAELSAPEPFPAGVC
jgi:glutathione S-transferase